MLLGNNRHLGNVEKNEPNEVDDLGHQVERWVVLYEKQPMEIITQSGNETDVAQQMLASADVQITMRWRPGIAPTNCRVVCNGHTYNIERTVNVKQQNRELQLFCTEEM